MIEVLIMLGVMGWFWQTARARGQNRLLWLLTGGLSYYVPAIVFMRYVYRPLVKRYITLDNYAQLVALGIALAIMIGAAFCLSARRLLLTRGTDTRQNRVGVSLRANDDMSLGGSLSGADALPLPVEPWTCPKCREQLEGQFDKCWECGTTRPAGPNPPMQPTGSAGG